jgi:transcriptional regulator with XRE-family HTH domain
MMHSHRVKETRERRGLSQQELADRTGIHVQQVYRIENAKSVPTADTLARLARELDVSADYLLGLTDDPEGHITEADLSPIERKLLRAWRQEDTREILRLLVELSEDDDKQISPSPDEV